MDLQNNKQILSYGEAGAGGSGSALLAVIGLCVKGDQKPRVWAGCHVISGGASALAVEEMDFVLKTQY